MWYEMFEDIHNQGSKTLEICKTLKEAKKTRQCYLKSGLWEKKELHIDKWTDKNNPRIVKSII